MASSDAGGTQMMSCRGESGTASLVRFLRSPGPSHRQVLAGCLTTSRLLHVRGSRLEWIRSPRNRGFFFDDAGRRARERAEASRALVTSRLGGYEVVVWQGRRSRYAGRHRKRIKRRFSCCSQIVCSCSCMIGRDMGPRARSCVVLAWWSRPIFVLSCSIAPSPASPLGHRHRSR